MLDADHHPQAPHPSHTHTRTHPTPSHTHTHTHTHPTPTIGGKQFQHVTHHPYLCVELTSDKNWEHHINQSVHKTPMRLLTSHLFGHHCQSTQAVSGTPFRPTTSTVWRVCSVKRQALSLVRTGGKPMWQPSWTISIRRSLQERRLVAASPCYIRPYMNKQPVWYHHTSPIAASLLHSTPAPASERDTNTSSPSQLNA